MDLIVTRTGLVQLSDLAAIALSLDFNSYCHFEAQLPGTGQGPVINLAPAARGSVTPLTQVPRIR